MGKRDPCIPLSNIDRFSVISTVLTRASNCSERLRKKRGQCSLPGMSSLRWDSI